MEYIFKLSFADAPVCDYCMLAFQKMGADNETHAHCAALGSRPLCPEEGCRKDCPLSCCNPTLTTLKEQLHHEIDSVIVKDTFTKGKNADLRKAIALIEDLESDE